MEKCKCGYPITTPLRIIREGWLGAKRIIQEYEIRCPKCGIVNKKRG